MLVVLVALVVLVGLCLSLCALLLSFVHLFLLSLLFSPLLLSLSLCLRTINASVARLDGTLAKGQANVDVVHLPVSTVTIK